MKNNAWASFVPPSKPPPSYLRHVALRDCLPHAVQAQYGADAGVQGAHAVHDGVTALNLVQGARVGLVCGGGHMGVNPRKKRVPSLLSEASEAWIFNMGVSLSRLYIHVLEHTVWQHGRAWPSMLYRAYQVQHHAALFPPCTHLWEHLVLLARALVREVEHAPDGGGQELVVEGFVAQQRPSALGICPPKSFSQGWGECWIG